MPSSETIELKHIKTTQGYSTDLPKENVTASMSSKIRSLLLDVGNAPILKHIYGGSVQDKTLTLDVGENYGCSVFSDGKYLYVGLSLPGQLIKIDIATFTKVDKIVLNAGEGLVGQIYSNGTDLFILTVQSLAIDQYIIKIDLQTFTRVATYTIAASQKIVSMYPDGTYIYFVGLNKLYRLNIETFAAPAESIALTNISALSVVLDGYYIYVAGFFGVINRVNKSTFAEVDQITSGTNTIVSMFIEGRYLYSVQQGGPAILTKVDLITFTNVGSLNLSQNVTLSQNIMFIDGTFLYIASARLVLFTPANIDIIDLASFTIRSTITFAAEINYEISAVFVDTPFIYIIKRSFPTQVIRKYLFPTNTAKDRQIDLIQEQTKTGTYYIRPSNAAGTTVVSGAGAYTKGAAYTQIIATNAITTNFYIDSVFLNTQTITRDFEIDIATGLAPSEVVIATVSNMVSNTNDGREYKFNPQIKVPANTRISARCSDSTGTGNVNVKIRYRI